MMSPLARLGMVVKEQFVKHQKNITVLLGLDVTTSEGIRETGRMWCFSLAGEGLSLILSSVNEPEESSYSRSSMLRPRSLFIQGMCCSLSDNIPAFYGLK